MSEFWIEVTNPQGDDIEFAQSLIERGEEYFEENKRENMRIIYLKKYGSIGTPIKIGNN